MSVIDVLWRQKDGTLIAVSEMDTSHVENALAMMERKLSMLVGDHPHRMTFIAEKMQQVVQQTEWWIITFKAELERRNTAWLDPEAWEIQPSSQETT